MGPGLNWYIYSLIGEGARQPVSGFGSAEIVNWRSDGKSIFIYPLAGEMKAFDVSVLTLPSGPVTPWKRIEPPRPVDSVENLHLTPDGRSYAYNFLVATSDLYVVDGLR